MSGTDLPPAERCCPGHGTMAHVRGCVKHPESAPAVTVMGRGFKRPEVVALAELEAARVGDA